jgi:hypothetical protein
MLLGLSAEEGWARLSGTPPYNGSVCGKPPQEGGDLGPRRR